MYEFILASERVTEWSSVRDCVSVRTECPQFQHLRRGGQSHLYISKKLFVTSRCRLLNNSLCNADTHCSCAQLWTTLYVHSARRVLIYAMRHPSPFQQCKSLWKPRVRHLATPNRAVHYTHTVCLSHIRTDGDVLFHIEPATHYRHLFAIAESLVNLRHIPVASFCGCAQYAKHDRNLVYRLFHKHVTFEFNIRMKCSPLLCY